MQVLLLNNSEKSLEKKWKASMRHMFKFTRDKKNIINTWTQPFFK